MSPGGRGLGGPTPWAHDSSHRPATTSLHELIDLTGRTAILAGGAVGIGLGIARGLLVPQAAGAQMIGRLLG